ncbi:hypothetical protein BSKO_13717 [Bryopsis sp. KO-2023]|nr:hypothetical protein BSKO_13717 [Bryopsis sp. KO-2023]
MMIVAACISILLGCVAGQLSDAATSTCSPFLTAIVTACDGEGQSFASEVGINLPATNGDLEAVSSDATAAALANIDATPGSSCCKAICGLSNTVHDSSFKDVCKLLDAILMTLQCYIQACNLFLALKLSAEMEEEEANVEILLSWRPMLSGSQSKRTA